MKNIAIKNIHVIMMCIFFILIDWVRFDLVRFVDNIGFNLILNLLVFVIGIVYVVLFIWSIVNLVRNYKSDGAGSVVPLVCMIMVLVYYWVVNNSMLYVDIAYKTNKVNMENTVNMYEAGELEQIGVDKYIAPYRLTSHNKLVYIKSEDGIDTAVFFVSNGYTKDRVIVYSDYGLDGLNDYGKGDKYGVWEFSNIKELDYNWYYAEVENK